MSRTISHPESRSAAGPRQRTARADRLRRSRAGRFAAGAAAVGVLLAAGGLADEPATAAMSAGWPLIVTQIAPNPAGADLYEFFQLYNTSDAPISLTDGSYSLAYSSNTTVPDSTRADYALTVGGTTTTVPAHGSLVLWNWTSDMSPTLTDADFRAFWKLQNAATPDGYALGRVTGTSGMSNSAARGIRVLDSRGENESYGFYDSGAYGNNAATTFALPMYTGIAQMRVFSTGVLAAPGAVDPAQYDTSGVMAGTSTFVPATSQGPDNAFGMIDTDRVKTMLQQMHMMGTVMLVKNGYATTVSNGLANAASGLPNGPNVLYATASLEKAMTATIVMQLISEGRLSFSSKLSDFFPQVPKSDLITVDMLLKHTSGISLPEMPVFVDPSDRSKGQVVLSSQSEQIQNAISTMKVGSQGTFSYSNGNYTMLAGIVSIIEGKDFTRVMQERVFDRAGMTHTYFWNTVPTELAPLVAQEYTVSGGVDYSTAGGPVATASLQSTLLGAGNLFTTIDDLHRFYIEMNGGSLLTQDQYRQLSASTLSNGYAGGLYHYPGNIKRARGSASTDEQAGRYNSFVYGAENNDDLVLILSNQSLISGNPAPLNGYDAFAENLYLALHTDPVLTALQSVETTLPAGSALTLPDTVSATLEGSAGATTLGVMWPSVSSETLAIPGVHEVTGQLLALHDTVTARVTVTAPTPSPTPTPTSTPTSTATAAPTSTIDANGSGQAGTSGDAAGARTDLATTGLAGWLVATILLFGVLTVAVGITVIVRGRTRSS